MFSEVKSFSSRCSKALKSCYDYEYLCDNLSLRQLFVVGSVVADYKDKNIDLVNLCNVNCRLAKMGDFYVVVSGGYMITGLESKIIQWCEGMINSASLVNEVKSSVLFKYDTVKIEEIKELKDKYITIKELNSLRANANITGVFVPPFSAEDNSAFTKVLLYTNEGDFIPVNVHMMSL